MISLTDGAHEVGEAERERARASRVDKGTWEVENDRTCLGNVELLDSPLFDLSRDTLRYGPAATLFAVFQMPLNPRFKSSVAWHRVPLMPLAIDLFSSDFRSRASEPFGN